MDNTLSEAERKTLNNFMRTDLGKKVLALIKESQQGYLDRAMINFMKGPEFTHDCVVAAAAVETVYLFLEPPEKTKEEEKDE